VHAAIKTDSKVDRLNTAYMGQSGAIYKHPKLRDEIVEDAAA
jgi:hypothetical protein